MERYKAGDELEKQLKREVEKGFNSRKEMVDLGVFPTEVFKTLNGHDLYHIQLKCNREVERFSLTEKSDEDLIWNISQGRRRSYKQTLWGVSGLINQLQIMARYNDLLENNELFRSSYFYKNISHSVKVVYKHTKSAFPIIDVSKLDKKNQIKMIENTLAAEARRQFEPEKSEIIRLVGFVIDKDKMIFLLSMYPHIHSSLGTRGVITKIAGDLKIDIDIIKNYASFNVDNINEKIKNDSISYWNSIVKPIGSQLKLPGEKKSQKNTFEKNSVYKVIEPELQNEIEKHCKDNNISIKAFWLLAWGYLLGNLNKEEEPLIAVARPGEVLSAFPVRIYRHMGKIKALRAIDSIIEESSRKASCTFEDICKENDIDANNYFKSLHNFLNLREFSEISDFMKAVDVMNFGKNDYSSFDLQVTYHLFGDEMGINYIYYRDRFYDHSMDLIHGILLGIAKEILSASVDSFDKTNYISGSDTNDEKMYKIDIAQKALYIQQTGIFSGRKAEDYMELAKKVTLANYSMNDEVLAEREAVTKIGILAEGKLEESRLGMDGNVRTIRILKEKNIFAYEGVVESNVMYTSFSVVSSFAKVVWIDRDVIIEFLNQNPYDWEQFVLLGKNDAERAKKLWTLN